MPASIVVVPMNQSSYEKNGCSAQIGDSVAPGVRARELQAAVLALDPSFVNFTMSAARTMAEQRLRALELHRRRAREVGPERQRACDRVHHLGIRVAEAHRAQAHAVLDELVAVDVPHPAAPAACDEGGRLAGILVVALRVGVAAAWHQRAQPFRQGT
jgi:hypothetical protein